MNSLFSPENLPPPPGIPIPASIAAATATTSASPAPTLIPKLEPFDEWLNTPTSQQQQSQDPNFSNGSLDLDLNLLCDGTSEPNNNLFSEFNRISQLFRTAFSANDPQNDAVPDPITDSLQQLRNDAFSNPFAENPQHIKTEADSDPWLQQAPKGTVPDPDSQAIVPVQEEEPSSMMAATTPRRRCKELVRVADLGGPEQRHFRDVVRRTRMVYDSLRVLATVEDERRVDARRGRSDLRASAVMRSCGLWLNRDKRIVGSIPGVCVGDVFLYRMELCVVGLHGQPQAGIDYLPASMSSNGEPIATSVIVSGGYEDDVDEGDVITYSGHGGQDKNSRQVCHQKLEGGNLAMERSKHYGIEVRVIRGVRYEGAASATGKLYVYDGLYTIIDCWFDVGKSGFGVFKYKLCRIDGQAKMGSMIMKEAHMLKKDPLSFKPMCCVSLDISNRKENVGVRLFNDLDRNFDPLRYEYLVKTNFPEFVFHQSGRGTGCDCVDGCVEGCFCAMKNGGEFPYNHSGILLRGKPLVFECGPFCQCPPHCRNRVTQKGLKNRMEVFRSRETGWGVRSLDLIQAGAFICEYTGVVLNREQAELLSMNGDSLIYPNRFTDRWSEWGDLSMIDSNYVRPSYPSLPPLDFALDVSRMRNVACYMSHSSTPNVLVQFVLYDHNNLMFPHLMLFAMENIPPMRELSLDYGVADEWTGKLSICN
ncbi:histone-lysine N-methyltransferase family member SUVH9-like [Vigna unguiculata]|uniref:Putative restriction endonuclease n=1 Tax=Vigna unguiculata TaxID=3917 RepID=A0A4D6LKY5_VIGUN|nr:histone-lysine N-methyltransferase family member SUVH9-like [Vigna unguiculata]XP_027914746.1 histone-lysine N-methyltransferase family member SUVH9-like [Vigna unguiculata]XP_027914747.1 histone-lysine N-methyltransferase family member SUVH9-like [Vigna unguiculata]XP_027914748.1 histone-lysine N-methyltransferase family member SUVH9-like [Vigna unguiculata]XP_027914749.1 histone-lysine N-methyltransferase family member SUVH9-like [Vigna unguiculata]XP_027914750.1 histone-lysine N-methyltr